jgi:5S rRNA maturation endonuclease (ribonuclease M5)
MSGGNKGAELEDLLDFVNDLKGKLVIAEGKKDGIALKTLGVKNILLLNGRPLTELALHVSKSCVSSGNRKVRKEVVILTDFDSEGEKLAARLDYLLRKYKVMVNSRLRRKFMKFGKTRVEDLKEGDDHGKISSNFNKICYNRAHTGQRCHREA